MCVSKAVREGSLSALKLPLVTLVLPKLALAPKERHLKTIAEGPRSSSIDTKSLERTRMLALALNMSCLK